MTATTWAVHETASASLRALAAEGATGALSAERGVFYLAAGRVVHVESALTPDLGALLTRSGAVTADGWWEAVGRDGARHRVGRRLVDSGRLAAGALEVCHLGALFDAAYVVLAHDGRPHRFRPGAAHWLGAVRSVPVDTVLRESRRRRALLDRIWPDPAVDVAPLARTPAAAGAELPARRGRTLAQVDGVRTAADIAAALACRTWHTLVELRRLAAGGLVTTARAPPRPRRPRTRTDRPPTRAGRLGRPRHGPAAPASRRLGGPVIRARRLRAERRLLMAVEREVLDELHRLRARVPQVTGSLAATVDGLVLAHDAPGTEPEGLAALTAAALGSPSARPRPPGAAGSASCCCAAPAGTSPPTPPARPRC